MIPLKKVLIVRFSSFGDINQCLFAAQALKDANKDLEIHWLTRADFSEYLNCFPVVDKVHSFQKQNGLLGIVKLALQLRKLEFQLIYDAHNNLRSSIVRTLLFGFSKVTRPKHRWLRILLFRFRINKFPKPFKGGVSYITPLKYYVTTYSPSIPKTKISSSKKDYVLIAPAAAWPLKEWPLDKWIKLIESSSDQFVILGGSQDKWLENISNKFPDRVTNLAGKTSWTESLKLVLEAKKVIGVDTGITHLADLLGVPAQFIIGPSAFGYPTRSTSKVNEVQLWCKPCTKDGRGRCINQDFKKCLTDISAEQIAEA